MIDVAKEIQDFMDAQFMELEEAQRRAIDEFHEEQVNTDWIPEEIDEDVIDW